MSPAQQKPATKITSPDSGWQSFYQLGGLAALLVVLAFLLDIAISMRGGDFNPAALSAIEWFALFRGDPLAGLRALGLINVVTITVSIALYLALYAAHRQELPGYAALALILFLVGAAIYISNSAAVPMWALSSRYVAASTDAQRTLLAAAGEAILARGADFAPGSFTGFFLTEMAGLVFSMLMLRSRIFGRATAIAGSLGFTLLAVFTIWTTFLPVFFEVAMIVALAGGLASVAWYLLVARRLFQLGKSPYSEESRRNSLVAAR